MRVGVGVVEAVGVEVGELEGLGVFERTGRVVGIRVVAGSSVEIEASTGEFAWEEQAPNPSDKQTIKTNNHVPFTASPHATSS